jgi:hypothetical protein
MGPQRMARLKGQPELGARPELRGGHQRGGPTTMGAVGSESRTDGHGHREGQRTDGGRRREVEGGDGGGGGWPGWRRRRRGGKHRWLGRGGGG